MVYCKASEESAVIIGEQKKRSVGVGKFRSSPVRRSRSRICRHASGASLLDCETVICALGVILEKEIRAPARPLFVYQKTQISKRYNQNSSNRILSNYIRFLCKSLVKSTLRISF